MRFDPFSNNQTACVSVPANSSGHSIAAVIVTYNRKEILLESLNAVFNQQNASCDVIVIDNASTDGTYEFLKERFNDRPDLIYINSGSNLGGAGGFQFGVREAMKRAYSYVWIMDDDTIPEPTALENLLLADQKLGGNWGFLVSAAYWIDGNICRMNIPKTTIFRHVKDEDYHGEMKKVVMCSFVSCFVKANVIFDVGLPIGEYFIWTDDYEFTGRISAKYSCYMVPESKVTHAMKRHIRVNFARDDASRIGRYHYIYRNDVHCYRRYGLWGWCYILLKDLYTVFDILVHSENHKVEKIKVIWKGFREGLHFHPVVEMIASLQD